MYMHMLCAGIIPRNWRRYTVPAVLTVMQWVTDFSERVAQLQSVSKQVASNGTMVLKVCTHTRTHASSFCLFSCYVRTCMVASGTVWSSFFAVV